MLQVVAVEGDLHRAHLLAARYKCDRTIPLLLLLLVVLLLLLMPLSIVLVVDVKRVGDPTGAPLFVSNLWVGL